MIHDLPLPLLKYVRMIPEGIGWIVIGLTALYVLAYAAFWLVGISPRDFVRHCLNDDFEQLTGRNR